VGKTRHIPVLLAECLQYLEPRPGKVFADLTLGGGGHSEALLQAGATVLGFDRDPEALARTSTRLLPHEDRFTPVHRGFGDLADVLGEMGRTTLDGVLMDLGLSSDQLDTARRGFAHRLDGPLDLRFDPTAGVSAAAWVADAAPEEIEVCLREYGEIRRPGRLARRMHEAARRGELTRTAELRELVVAQTPAARREAELARVFQALRIQVNEELDELERVLSVLPQVLAPGGRFVCISYHSLEDRRVKRALRDGSDRRPRGSRHLPEIATPDVYYRLLTPKVVRPQAAEIAANPRARSARLRAAERVA
jgi:16S rRNA (cytosine1402-N4)-methyltransferase